MRKSIIAASICLMAMPIAAQAEEPQNIAAFDYLLEYEDLAGKTVQIDDCQAYGVSVDFFLCSVSTETGTAGTINVRLKETPKKQLAYGLKKCGSIMETEADICTATVIGTADKTSNGDAKINAKEIIWHAEK